jgi:transposase-like protein
MSPSPTWSSPAEVPVFQALAAAQHDAWHAADTDSARRIFADRVRQALGADRADVVLSAALNIFNTQLLAPKGFEAPPPSAPFTICARCQQIKKTKFTIPQNGRLKLTALRDRQWLAKEFERGRTCKAIAQQLDCSTGLVMDWARKHGLQPVKTANAEKFREAVRELHLAGNAPGEIARELDRTTEDVRKALAALGLANMKSGHHYFAAEWWIERIQRRGWTTGQCAKAAGIRPHGCCYFLNKFGLDHITRARTLKKGQRRNPKYPQLTDAAQLAELLRVHGSYEAVARAVGCPSPSLVSRWARELLGVGKRHENFKETSAKSWWTERLDRGMTTWALAEEAGVEEKTVREKLRVFGQLLLAQAYRNNTAAEKAKRAPKRPDWTRPQAVSA